MKPLCFFLGGGVQEKGVQKCAKFDGHFDQMSHNLDMFFHVFLCGCCFSGTTQLPFPVPFSKFGVLQASSIQPKYHLRFLSHGCAFTNDICKLRIHVFRNHEWTNTKLRIWLARLRKGACLQPEAGSHISKLPI